MTGDDGDLTGRAFGGSAILQVGITLARAGAFTLLEIPGVASPGGRPPDLGTLDPARAIGRVHEEPASEPRDRFTLSSTPDTAGHELMRAPTLGAMSFGQTTARCHACNILHGFPVEHAVPRACPCGASVAPCIAVATAPSPGTDHLPVGEGDQVDTSAEYIVAAIRAAETPANSEACGHLATVILGDGPTAERSALHLVEHTCWGEGFTGTDAAAAIIHVRQAAEQEFQAQGLHQPRVAPAAVAQDEAEQPSEDLSPKKSGL